MTNIEWIIFSKYRTLQLKSCVISITALSKVKAEEINVLYVDSGEISYEPLKKELPCRFIRQAGFYNDVMGILRASRTPFVIFVVDDMIFRDNFSSAQIERLMGKYPDLDCFSLRLGKNIKDGRQPEFEELEPGIISWKTAGGLGKSWNYFWELTSSVYRKEAVLDYLKRCGGRNITFPNPMEFMYYRIMPNIFAGSRGILRTLLNPRYMAWSLFCPQKRIKKMACYEKSRAFAQDVNLVADRGNVRETYISTNKLHELYREGYTVDFRCLKDVPNERPNTSKKYFRITNKEGKIHPLSFF